MTSQENGIYYEITNWGAKVYRCADHITHLEIPAYVYHEGRRYHVNAMGHFYASPNLTSITLPETFNHFCYWALGDYGKNITEIHYKGTLESWCHMYFGDNWCPSLYRLFINGEEIKDLIIPRSIRRINNWAFAHANIQSIRVLHGVAYIGNYAFMGCSNLKTVRLPNSIDCVGEDAFWIGHDIQPDIYVG